MGVSFYQILIGFSGLYFANRYIYKTFFNTIPKKKKLAEAMTYLTPKKQSLLSGMMLRAFPYLARKDAKNLHAFQCLCSVPEYELIAPIAVPREKVISAGSTEDDGVQLFQAIYDSKAGAIRILSFNEFMEFHRSRKSIQIFEKIDDSEIIEAFEAWAKANSSKFLNWKSGPITLRVSYDTSENVLTVIDTIASAAQSKEFNEGMRMQFSEEGEFIGLRNKALILAYFDGNEVRVSTPFLKDPTNSSPFMDVYSKVFENINPKVVNVDVFRREDFERLLKEKNLLELLVIHEDGSISALGKVTLDDQVYTIENPYNKDLFFKQLRIARERMLNLQIDPVVFNIDSKEIKLR